MLFGEQIKNFGPKVWKCFVSSKNFLSEKLPGYNNKDYRTIYGALALFCPTFPLFILGSRTWIFLFSSIAYLCLAVIVWMLFIGEIPFPSQRNNREHSITLHNVWFWVFALGLYYALVNHWYTFLQSDTDYSVRAYVECFLHKGGMTNVFAVFFLSMLADFLIIFFNRLSEYHNQVESLKESLSESANKLEQQANSLKEMQSSSGKNLKNLKKTQEIHDKWIQDLTDQGDFLEKCNRHDRTEKISACYRKLGPPISSKIAKSLEPYIQSEQKNAFIEKDLACSFLRSYFSEQKGAQQNRVQANFATMARIVDQLYSNREEYYSCYSNSDEYKNQAINIVYFTTLTMSLYKYLNPNKLFGGTQSALAEWDYYRRKTRKSVYSTKGQFGKYDHDEGYMWSFLREHKKYSFQRCCIYLENDAKTHSSDDGILSQDEWEMESKKEINNLFKVCGERTPFGNNYEYPSYLELLHGDPIYASHGGDRPPIAIDVFKKLYHPRDTDFHEKCLNSDWIEGFVKKNETTLKQAFPRDKIWLDMLSEIKKGNFVVQGEDADDRKWHDIFFNQHLPVDIFAIGVEKSESKEVDWKGCLSGFVGGDFHRMDLGWDDKYISSASVGESNPWRAIEALIKDLYVI